MEGMVVKRTRRIALEGWRLLKGGDAWGSAVPVSVLCRRVVKADMRGLGTAGPCLRRERDRWSKFERRRVLRYECRGGLDCS